MMSIAQSVTKSELKIANTKIRYSLQYTNTRGIKNAKYGDLD